MVPAFAAARFEYGDGQEIGDQDCGNCAFITTFQANVLETQPVGWAVGDGSEKLLWLDQLAAPQNLRIDEAPYGELAQVVLTNGNSVASEFRCVLSRE